ncbi:hypothetical protein FA13DRAFT_80893 [Coprinellus micaceus]|uniref:Uncharacterized protein n=1 Tax=Coprinellus micaceus TaxID=71717 RepID=A0A4Y7TJI8_COPMI|nr:hypothetical protein FA13DRAFT_80893 [Coprinellus micaceus]
MVRHPLMNPQIDEAHGSMYRLIDLINMCRAGGRNMDRITVGNPPLTSIPGDSGIPRTFTSGSVTSASASTSAPPSTSSTLPPSSTTALSASLPTTSTSSAGTSSSSLEHEGPPSPTSSLAPDANQAATAGPPADPLAALLGAGPPSDEGPGVATNGASRTSRRWFGWSFSSGRSGIDVVWLLSVYVGLWTFVSDTCL